MALSMKMDGELRSETDKDGDFRIKLTSKRKVVDQLAKYKHLLRNLLVGQSRLSEDDKEKLTQELMLNFELAVQENVAINGLSWEEAPDDDGNAPDTNERQRVDCSVRRVQLEDVLEDEQTTLDDMLDEEIVQTTWKRRVYPKKILPHVVRSLKAERKLMGLYEQTVKPQEVKMDPVQEAVMQKVADAAPSMAQQARAVMQSLQTLQQSAEGLQQVLDMQPSAQTRHIYREFLSPAPAHTAPGHTRTELHTLPIKAALLEATYSCDYVPLPKKLTVPSDDVPSSDK